MPAGIQWEGIRTADWFDAGNTMHVVAASDQPDLSAVAALPCLHCVDCASCYSSGCILLWQREACSELCARAKLHALYKGYLLLRLLLWYWIAFLWFGKVRHGTFLYKCAFWSSLLQHFLNACVCLPSLGAFWGRTVGVILPPAVGTLEGPKAILPAFTL